MTQLTAKPFTARPLTARPFTAYQLGQSTSAVDPLVKYAASDGTLPTLVIDLYRGFYYWGGEQKTLSDMTEVSGKGYYIEDMSWFNSSAFTLGIEYEVPQTGLVTGEHAMSLAIPGNAASRFGFSLTNVAQPQLECQPLGGSYSKVNQLRTGTVPRFGRCRSLVRTKNNEAYKIIEDGTLDVATGVANNYLTTAFTRLSVGYRHFYTYEDSPLQTGDSVCVVGWDYGMSDAVMKATALTSPDRLPAIHMLADSIGNEQVYSNGGGVISRIKKLATDDGYASWSESVVGSTTLEDFYTRYAANTDHHNDSLIILEGGMDWDGVDTLGALQDIIGDLNSSRWFIVEPIYGSAYTEGSANRIGAEAAFDAMASWAGEGRVIRTLAALQAENDGSAGDLADLADDIVPRSLRGDTIHLNFDGAQVLAQAIYDAIKAAGWY